MKTFTKKVISLQITLLFFSVFVILCLSFATVWAEQGFLLKKTPALQMEQTDITDPVYAKLSSRND